MRTAHLVVLTLALIVLPTASAAPLPPPPITVCDVEEMTTGGSEICDAGGAAIRQARGTMTDANCILIWEIANEAPACGIAYAFDFDGERYYVALAPDGIYRESNGCDGLQQAPSDCDGDGVDDPRDHSITLDDYALHVEPVASALCDFETFGTGYHNACDEARDPTRLASYVACSAQSDACGPAAAVELNWGTFYVAPAGVFRESNGCAGWQGAAAECDGDAQIEPADEPMPIFWPWS